MSSYFSFESIDLMMAEYDLINHVFRVLRRKILSGSENEVLVSGDYLSKKYLDSEHGDYVDTHQLFLKFRNEFKLNGNFYIDGINQKIMSISLTDEMATAIKFHGPQSGITKEHLSLLKGDK